MPDASKKRSSPLQFLLLFLVVYLLSDYALKAFFPKQFSGQPDVRGVIVTMKDATVRQGNDPMVVVENAVAASGASVVIASRCPEAPFTVQRLDGGSVDADKPADDAAEIVGCVQEDIIVRPGEVREVSLAPWKYRLFWDTGRYEVQLATSAGTGSALTQTGRVMMPAGTGTQAQVDGYAVQPQDTLRTQFEVYEPGVFAKLFRTFITKPFLNFLVFAASWLPGHNLGWAIILLTLLVKLLLFLPTQHALEGQKKMQLIQPKMEEIKKKYKGDAMKIQEETMKLWKEAGVNPWQSCLPTLVQFPVLIGLFTVIRDGSHLALSQHLLYPVYRNLDWTFGTNFLGLDLLSPNIWIMPILLLVLQFLQMKLTFAIAERRKKRQDIIDVPSAKEIEREIKNAPTDPADAQKLQQNIMLYGLPIMIAVMAVQFPAAVALYWATQAVFSVGQQVLVNRRTA